jgi:hypothetical protein
LDGKEHSYHTLWWWKLLLQSKLFGGGNYFIIAVELLSNCREDFGLQS